MSELPGAVPAAFTPPGAPAPHDLPRAAGLMITASFGFAAMGACVQLASRTLPSAEVVFMRNAVALLFFIPWLARRGLREALRTKNLFEHLVRGGAGLTSMYCFFFAISRLRLADAVLLNYTLPLFIPLVESVWLHEPMPARLWPGLLVGFAGVALVLRPGGELFQPLALLGLGAGLMSAVAQTGVRRLTQSEPIERIIFYFTALSTVASAVPAVPVWVTPSLGVAGLLVLVGIFAMVGQVFMTRAYSHAPASQVGGFIYTAVLFAAIFDWLRTGAAPHPLFVVGGGLICGAGALTLRLAPRARAAKAKGSG